MKRLNEGHRAAAVDDKLRLVAIALAAAGLAETTELATSIQQWRAQLATARADHAKKLFALRTATQEVVRLDKAVGRATVRVAQGYADHRDQDRTDPTFALAFPIAPSEATRTLADDRQHLYVRNAIKVLRAVPDLPNGVSKRIDALEAAQTELEAAVTRRQSAREAEALSQGQLEQLLKSARQAYNHLYFHLGRIYNGDIPQVERFFG